MTLSCLGRNIQTSQSLSPMVIWQSFSKKFRNPLAVFEYMRRKSVATEKMVPYKHKNMKCTKKNMTSYKVAAWGMVNNNEKEYDEIPPQEMLKNTLCKHGPLVAYTGDIYHQNRRFAYHLNRNFLPAISVLSFHFFASIICSIEGQSERSDALLRERVVTFSPD